MVSKNRKSSLFIFLIFIYSFVLDFIHINYTYFIDHNVPACLNTIPSSPFWLVDSEIFDNSARLLLEGKKIDSGIPFRPPLYILVLSGIFKISAENYLMAKLISSVLLCLSCIFIYLTGAILLNELTGMITSVLWASSFGKIMMSGSLNNESLYLFLVSFIIYILVRKNMNLDFKGCILFGLLSGLAMLTRSEYQLFFIIILSLYFIKKKKFTRPYRNSSIIILVALTVIAPWMLRNYFSISKINEKYGYGLNKFVPITSYGALNFATANNEDADGGFSRNILEADDYKDKDFSFDNPQHLFYFKNGYEEGLKFLKSNPGKGLKLFWKKIVIVSDALSFGYLTFDFPSGINGFRRYIDVFSPEDKLSYLLHIILLSIGLALIILEKKFGFKFLPVYAAIFTTMVANILFFGYVRLGLTILPYILLFISYPLSLIIESLKDMFSLSKPQSAILLSTVLIMLLVTSFIISSNSATLKTEALLGGKLTRISYQSNF